MPIKVEKSSPGLPLEESRADTQRALASLTAALTPDLDAQICFERALAAHRELTAAIEKLERALPETLIQKCPDITRPDNQTPLEVAVLLPDCPTRVRKVLAAIVHIRNGGNPYGGYDKIVPLVRDDPPMTVLAHFARFSESNFKGIRQVGRGTIDELAAFLATKGVTLKGAKAV